mgnify:CR=1 FL=1
MMEIANTAMSGKMTMAITSKFITMAIITAHTEKGEKMLIKLAHFGIGVFAGIIGMMVAYVIYMDEDEREGE